MQPSVARLFDVEVGAQSYKFFLGLRAWKILGVNPLSTQEVTAYFTDLTIDKACAMLAAGIENAAKLTGATDQGPSPTTDDLLDVMDLKQFAAILPLVQAITGAGEKPASGASSDENPTSAQDGQTSGQLDASISG